MEKTYIFMTVGGYCRDIDDPLFNLVKEGKIDGLRFNLGKCDNIQEVYKRARFINAVKAKYDKIQIMLDIPFPGYKLRIKLKNNKLLVAKGQLVTFSHDESAYLNNIIIQSEEFFNKIKSHQQLIYSDGDCIFKVISIDAMQLKAQAVALNNAVLYTGKSITFGFIPHCDKFPIHFSKVIQMVNPNFVALSFVSGGSDIRRYQEIISSGDIEVVSKIESLQAIDNLEDISKESEIMLARGDLLLNVPYPMFPMIQERIAIVAQRNSRKLFCATGILNSYIQMDKMVPSQADLNDLYILLSYNPYALVLNYSENRLEGCYRTLEIINQMR